MASNPLDELPAILGGPAVCPDGLPAWPRADAQVQSALHAAIASGAWGQYQGEHVSGLEEELAALYGVPHVLTCASGTLAVETALWALGVGPGDEVVMAAYEYESNFLSVHSIGAMPVLIDVAASNWNLNPTHLLEAFSPKTKAVICSHLHGGLVAMREVMVAATRRGIGVVEDAAQAPGATVQGKPAGTWGDIGTLSFGGSKLLSAGRGGALLIRDAQLYQRARLRLHRGIQQWAPLSELQAAALRPQLAKLPDDTKRRADNAAILGDAIRAAAPALVPFENTTDESQSAFYKMGLRYDASVFGLPRERFVEAMRAEGIAMDVGFKALHIGRSPSRFRAACDLTNATAAHHGCVVLHHPVLLGTGEDMGQVAIAAEKIHRHRGKL